MEDVFQEFDSSNTETPRRTVIACHNSISYQVDGITDEFSPLTCKFAISEKGKEPREVSMAQYFQETYRIDLD